MDTLRRTLAALEHQDMTAGSFEVVVVDNGSIDATSELLEELARTSTYPLTVLTEPTPGTSAARNAGLAVARHEIVLFLGDDTAPADSGLLASHLRLHALRPAKTYAVLGHVDWAPHIEVTSFMRWLERGRQFAFASIDGSSAGAEHLYTAHVSLKRALLEQVGGFDPRLPFLYEDLELGMRLAEAGMDLEYRKELAVHHDHVIPIAQWRRRQQAAGRSGARMHDLGAMAGRHLPRPHGLRWMAARMLVPVLVRSRSEWALLPPWMRERVFLALHCGAYAEGYRASTTTRVRYVGG